MAEAIPILQDRANLFVDDHLICDSAFVSRRWHEPKKYPEPVLIAEHPWERYCPVIYGTVLFHQNRFRMWYACWSRKPLSQVCYAESEDGIFWSKPELGIHKDDSGSGANNIVLRSSNYPDGLVDDIAVIADEDDAEWPLKALYWDSVKHEKSGEFGIYAARSKDGIHWETLDQVLPGWGDRFNAVGQRVDGKFVLYARHPKPWTEGRPEERKRRTVYRVESDDLINWSEPELVMTSDHEDPPSMEIYSMTVFPYETLSVGAIERMWRSPDKLDIELAWSRDNGQTFSRSRQRPTFIPRHPVRGWDDSWINLGTAGPIKHDDHLWFYYSGRSGAHGSPTPLNKGGIGLAILRLDGFASIYANEHVGTLATHQLDWPGGVLQVNVDPRRDLESHPHIGGGEMRVEVRGEDNEALPGFSFDDCQPLRQNSWRASNASVTVHWQDERTTEALGARPLSLAFQLRDAHLYSFRATSNKG